MCLSLVCSHTTNQQRVNCAERPLGVWPIQVSNFPFTGTSKLEVRKVEVGGGGGAPCSVIRWRDVCERKTAPTPRNTALLQKPAVPQLVKKSPAFSDSLRSSQESATCTYPQLDKPSPCHPTYLRPILILPSHLRLGLMVSFPEVSPPKPCMQLSLTLYVPHAP
jgi:hypothetical protein